MSQRNVPITRLGKFFGAEDFTLDVGMGREWLEGDMNFTLILYKIDKQRTDIDDVYGEALSNGIKFHPPIEFKGYVLVSAPENKNVGNTKINQYEPGNIRISVYQSHLDELGIDIEYGDYIGYYEKENRVRYYSVTNDGEVVSDNKHTYGGVKPFYRTIEASPVGPNEFNGV
jgi:hypothetical protein